MPYFSELEDDIQEQARYLYSNAKNLLDRCFNRGLGLRSLLKALGCDYLSETNREWPELPPKEEMLAHPRKYNKQRLKEEFFEPMNKRIGPDVKTQRKQII